MIKDYNGTICHKCKKGRYQETSIHDDLDGVVHCSKCDHKIKRFQENKMKIKETIERDCCDPNRDLERFMQPAAGNYKRCVHCGRVYEFCRKLGDIDYFWHEVEFDLVRKK